MIDQVCVPQTVAKRRQAPRPPPPPPPPFHPLLTSPLLLLSLQARTVPRLSLSLPLPLPSKNRNERGIKEKFQIRSHPSIVYRMCFPILAKLAAPGHHNFPAKEKKVYFPRSIHALHSSLFPFFLPLCPLPGGVFQGCRLS